MWIGSPAAISIVPRSSAGAKDSPPAAAEAAGAEAAGAEPAGDSAPPADGDAPLDVQAASTRSAATPSAPTRIKRFKLSPPRDPIGPNTRPIRSNAIWALPTRIPGRTPGRPFESLDCGPLQDRAPGVPGVLLLDRRPDLSPGGAQVAAEAMPYHIRRRTECNTVRPRPAPSSSCPLAGPGRRGPGWMSNGSFRSSIADPFEVDPKAWNIWSERPVSRTSIGSSP